MLTAYYWLLHVLLVIRAPPRRGEITSCWRKRWEKGKGTPAATLDCAACMRYMRRGSLVGSPLPDAGSASVLALVST